MWQRFTERARKVVFYAQEEAQKFGEGYVSTEHLLLGLIREPETTAALVLNSLGVSLIRIRLEVEKQLPRGESRPSQDMTLTPRAKRVIDLAYDEARNLSNNYIGTEHLLLGLIREGDGLAGRVLQKLGLEIERARNEVRQFQAEQSVAQATLPEVPTQRVPARLHLLADEYELVLEAFHLKKLRNGQFVPETLALMLLVDEKSEIRKVLKRMKVKVPKLIDAIEGPILFTVMRDPETSLQTILDATLKEAAVWGPSELFLAILTTASPHLKSILMAFRIYPESFRAALQEVRGK